MDQEHKDVLNGDMAPYEKWAPMYEEGMAKVGYLGPRCLAPQVSTVLETHFKDKDSVSVLDIGCGTGLTSREIVKVVTNSEKLAFTGVDISPAMLEEAKATGLYKDLT